MTGPGDDGGSNDRAGGTLVLGETTALQIQKVSTGPLYFDLWYSNRDRVAVSISTPGGVSGPFAPPASDGDTVYQSQPEFDLYHYGSDVDSYGAENDKRELFVNLDGPPGQYSVNLEPASIVDGRFDATLNPATYTGGSPTNVFMNHVAPGNIWDAASARYNICPGDYVFRTTWTDIDHQPQAITGQGRPGELWHGSSQGPTFDGRLGIDVCAPGNTLFTTYGADTYWATFRFNLAEGGNGLYGAASAVSAAAPIVTGAIALMLEMNPELDAAEVKSILQRTAFRDGFTGEDESAAWGYGKLDVFGAVAAAEGGTRPTINSVAVNLSKGKVTLKGSGFAAQVEVFVNGIPFVAPAKSKLATKVVQKGLLENGRTLSQQIDAGETVTIYVRNSGGGTSQVEYKRPS